MLLSANFSHYILRVYSSFLRTIQSVNIVTTLKFQELCQLSVVILLLLKRNPRECFDIKTAERGSRDVSFSLYLAQIKEELYAK